MENQVVECKLESLKNDSLQKNDVKIILEKYSNDATEFNMFVKANKGGILEDMFRMFINYFALMKCEHIDVPEWVELRISPLRPMALAVSNELVKAYNPAFKEELTGEDYLDQQTEQRFQFLRSRLDKLV